MSKNERENEVREDESCTDISGRGLTGERDRLLADKTDAEERANALTEEAARVRADFYNYRTRVERDRERDRRLASEQAVSELLPVLENLERISESIEKDGQLHKGMTMVIGQFSSVLCGLGMEQVCTDGQFDPGLHEAVELAPVDDPSQDGVVLGTLRKGYKLAGRVLRAAQVRVGKLQDKS